MVATFDELVEVYRFKRFESFEPGLSEWSGHWHRRLGSRHLLVAKWVKWIDAPGHAVVFVLVDTRARVGERCDRVQLPIVVDPRDADLGRTMAKILDGLGAENH